MNYIVQIFKMSSLDANVGKWHNTAWGSDNSVDAESLADEIAKGNTNGITKVRVVNVVKELDCINVTWPRGDKICLS